MPSTQNTVNNHEYRSVPITALASQQPIPANGLMQRVSKNWPPASKRKGFWPLFWYANWRKASTKLSPGHVA
jgi:hypothetical protein